ncbi:MAG: hypothetical protein OCD01_20105 [Fibrobacterales bacterium]
MKNIVLILGCICGVVFANEPTQCDDHLNIFSQKDSLYGDLDEKYMKIILDNQFAPVQWKKSRAGWWYYLVSTGLNGGSMIANHDKTDGNVGMHIGTAIGYASRSLYSFEIGSMVAVDFYDEIPAQNANEELGKMVFWNTKFFWAVRFLLPNVTITPTFMPYVKLLQGWGKGVGFLFALDEGYEKLAPYRFQFEGPLFGFSIGNMFNPIAGTPWFVEFTTTLQTFWNGYQIDGNSVVPEIKRVEMTENSRLFHFALSVGVNLF